MRRRLGSYLKHLRTKIGKTQWDIAQGCDYTTAQFVSNWERNVTLPPAKMLPTLARLYRAPLKDLVEALAAEKIAEIEEWKKQAMKLGRAG